MTPKSQVQGSDRIGIKRKRLRFFIVEDSVTVDPRVGHYDLSVYVALCYFANSATGECWPGTGTIAKVARCSRDTVIRAIRRLCEMGYLEKHIRKGIGSSFLSNLYVITGKRVVVARKDEGSRCGRQGGGSPGGNEQENRTNKKWPVHADTDSERQLAISSWSDLEVYESEHPQETADSQEKRLLCRRRLGLAS